MMTNLAGFGCIGFPYAVFYRPICIRRKSSRPLGLSLGDFGTKSGFCIFTESIAFKPNFFKILPMFNVIAKTLNVRPLDQDILEVAYDLYLQAPESSHPLINLKEVAQQTGESPLHCRNAIVSACQAGRFPNCSLAS